MRTLEWMRAVRDHRPKPPANSSRYVVLFTLALRLSSNGEGFCSARQLANDVDAGERTVRRHIAWAIETGFLKQTRRGHRITDGTAIASEYRLTQPDTGDRLTEPQHATDGRLARAANGVPEESRWDIPTGQAGDPTCQIKHPNLPRVAAPEPPLQEPPPSLLGQVQGSPAGEHDLPLSRGQRERGPTIDVEVLAWELDADFDATGYLANHNWFGDTEELIEGALAELKTKSAINDASAWLFAALQHMSPVRKAAKLIEIVGEDDE